MTYNVDETETQAVAQPQFSRTITLGSVLSASGSIITILVASVGWGIAYGVLSNSIAENTKDTIALATRVAAVELAAIDTGKVLVEVRIDVGYLRRWVEDLRRREDSP